MGNALRISPTFSLAFLDVTVGSNSSLVIGSPDNSWYLLEVRLRVEGAFDVTVPLRKRAELLLIEQTRELLLQAVPLTGIEMPKDKYDPQGKFAR